MESAAESAQSQNHAENHAMFGRITPIPQNLLALENPPKQLFYKGDLSLLNHFKIAVVGTRAPNPYTKSLTAQLVAKCARHAVIVSGGALGVDIIAHQHAFPRTIMISPSSLDIIYPKENQKIIQNIAQDALIISEYERGYMPQRHSFLERNRLVIALSDIVILPQGDLRSGTSSSARYALALKKPIFTLPHRYNESTLTNELLAKNQAKAIYSIDDFIAENLPKCGDSNDSSDSSARDSADSMESNDEILAFCAKSPSFEEAIAKFGNKILEYEFEGLLVRENNTVRVK